LTLAAAGILTIKMNAMFFTGSWNGLTPKMIPVFSYRHRKKALQHQLRHILVIIFKTLSHRLSAGKN